MYRRKVWFLYPSIHAKEISSCTDFCTIIDSQSLAKLNNAPEETTEALVLLFSLIIKYYKDDVLIFKQFIFYSSIREKK